ncbi:ABC transporter ATP-binding protein [Candidatus Woesearchaeota archaeon]|nr:ABC transporter ATP-binding protein [Candidatus Woesearchaeota archaeon]
MKRLMLLVLFFYILPIASADLYTVSEDCLSDGSMTLALKNTGEEEIKVTEIKVSAKKQQTETEFVFYLKNIAGKSSEVISPGKTTDFFSEKGIFSEEGTYVLEIQISGTYKEGSPYYSYGQSYTSSIYCAEDKYAICGFVNLLINECYTRNERFHGIFTVDGFMQDHILNPTNGITYDIKSTAFNYHGHLISNQEIIRLASNKYEVIVPIGKETIVDSFSASVDACNSRQYPKTTSIKFRCEERFEVQKNTIQESVPVLTEVPSQQSEPLVKVANSLIEKEPPENKKSFLLNAFSILGILSIFLGSGVILQSLRNKKKKKIIQEEEKTTEAKEAIRISNFTQKHGRTVLLEDVSFEIQSGNMVCILGPSGTGKSTIIESLIGRIKPTQGTIKVLGKDISKEKNVRNFIGFVPQHPELYTNQSAFQNMLSSATKWKVKNAKNKAEETLKKIGLEERKEVTASKLSGGQQKLLSLGMELIRDIEICILDEPTTGLDPNTRNNIITTLSNITSRLHKTVLFTTHFMDDAEECDVVIILSDKHIVAQGHPSKLKKSLPGGGNLVNIVLDNLTEELFQKIKKIKSVKNIIREGRNLRILTEEPKALQLGREIEELGGAVNEAKLDKATMKEVFVYYTGKEVD